MNAHVVRAGASVVAALCLLVTARAAAPQGQQKMALVTVVADGSGPIRDLTAKDFIVTEDGQKREVVGAALADDPLSVALLVDTSSPAAGTTPPVQDLRNALTAFVKAVQSQNSAAHVSLSEFGGAAVERVPFSKPGDLGNAIGRLYPNQQGQAVLLEALVDAGKQLAAQPAPRRAIVSVDFNTPEGSAERTMKNAVEAVHKAGATLWSVSVRGSVSTTPSREDVLNKMVQANGGLRLMPVDVTGLDPNLKIVANSLASQYTVSFMRTGGNPKTTKFETTRGAKVQMTPWMR